MSEDTPVHTEENVLNVLNRRRFLKGTAGVAASVAAIPALSGVAAAHFPVELDIDVQPENEDNFIDLNKHGQVSVMVHSSEFLNSDGERETFDPTERDVRYRFGSRSALDDGAGARPVDDGEVTTTTTEHGDQKQTTEVLTLSFPVGETGLDSGDDTAWLYWERDESGEHGYSGVDTVSVYGGKPSFEDLLELLRRLLGIRNGR
ncbi:twin-arginine translocation signal domain-containing protein [Halegenticoccus soli]|uniref:twin-arginine translocation signal domain-containing protein n=1 Tax=Halegenticoccus soli TaxID=1985678 RepID=UPI00117B3A25|nr:twin-arginine translocation signal domain-containing protein [Halegenticoccus soli]